MYAPESRMRLLSELSATPHCHTHKHTHSHKILTATTYTYTLSLTLPHTLPSVYQFTHLHCLTHIPSLPLSLTQTLEDEIKRLADLEAASKQTSFTPVGEEGPIFCAQCTTEMAEVHCEICTTYYCESCCDIKHKRPPWNAHKIIKLADMNYSGVTGIPEGRITKDKKKRKRPKSPGVCHGYNLYVYTPLPLTPYTMC